MSYDIPLSAANQITINKIIAAIFQSSSANPAAAGVIRLANGDVIAFRNGANSADLQFAVNASQFAMNAPLIINPTSNQVVLGSVGGVNFVTLTAPTPASSRTYTIPDSGANSSFVMTDGAATINGVKTFSAQVIAPEFTTTNGTSASLNGTGTNTTALFSTTSNQAYLVHVRGNSDAGFVGVWSVWDTAGGINSFKHGGQASLSLVQSSAGVVGLTTTSSGVTQTYNYSVMRFTND